jgi:hypothetical protein
MCGVMFATTEELALMHREGALFTCEIREKNLTDKSELVREASAELMPECHKNRAYIKDRWGLLPTGETK